MTAPTRPLPGQVALVSGPPILPSEFRQDVWFLAWESQPCRHCGMGSSGRYRWVVHSGRITRYEVAADGSRVLAVVLYGDFDEAARPVYPVAPDPADGVYLSESAARSALPLARRYRAVALRLVRRQQARQRAQPRWTGRVILRPGTTE